MISVHIYDHGKSLISVFVCIKICIATNSSDTTMNNQTSKWNHFIKAALDDKLQSFHCQKAVILLEQGT